MGRKSLRDDLLRAGVRRLWESGYGATGVRDLVAEANAPQGSFTNHFRSKEEFAGEVLDRYFEYVRSIISETLGNTSLGPTQRLRSYFEAITKRLGDAAWARGCMIGNFSLETSPHSERLRERLAEIFRVWREPFAACIAEAQAVGETSRDFATEDLADFLIASWQGAILRMKVDRSPEPLERFKHIVFTTLFREAEA